jgi:hypothetical protein
MQLANRLVLSTVSRHPENTNDSHIVQPDPPVERVQILWESPSHLAESAEPVDETPN